MAPTDIGGTTTAAGRPGCRPRERAGISGYPLWLSQSHIGVDRQIDPVGETQPSRRQRSSSWRGLWSARSGWCATYPHPRAARVAGPVGVPVAVVGLDDRRVSEGAWEALRDGVRVRGARLLGRASPLCQQHAEKDHDGKAEVSDDARVPYRRYAFYPFRPLRETPWIMYFWANR
jgi:hypothetical protein